MAAFELDAEAIGPRIVRGQVPQRVADGEARGPTDAIVDVAAAYRGEAADVRTPREDGAALTLNVKAAGRALRILRGGGGQGYGEKGGGKGQATHRWFYPG